MKRIAVKTVLIYAILLAVLVAILKAIEYRFLVKKFSVDIYLGAVALIFTLLGIWIASMIIRKRNDLNKRLVSNEITPVAEEILTERECEVYKKWQMD